MRLTPLPAFSIFPKAKTPTNSSMCARHAGRKHVGAPYTSLSRLSEIDKSKPAVTICEFRKLSYFAARILKQNGNAVKNLSDGVYVR